MSEKTPLTNEMEGNRESSPNRQKIKIVVYLFTFICGIGYIASGAYGLGHTESYTLDIQIVTWSYSILAGLFVIIVLFPIPHWKNATELWFPFMYTFFGRIAFFGLIGPLLISAKNVGLAFATLSILNALAYFIIYLVLRNDLYIRSFFRPFDKDVPDSIDHVWEYLNPDNIELGGSSPPPPSSLPSPSPSPSPSLPPPSLPTAPKGEYNPFGSVKGEKENVGQKVKGEKENVGQKAKGDYNPFGNAIPPSPRQVHVPPQVPTTSPKIPDTTGVPPQVPTTPIPEDTGVPSTETHLPHTSSTSPPKGSPKKLSTSSSSTVSSSNPFDQL